MLAGLVALAALAPEARAAASGLSAGGWSAARLGDCALSAPQSAFPSSAPQEPTGPGAIVWLAQPGGCAGKRPADLELAPLGLGSKAGPPVARPLGLSAGAAAFAPQVVGAGFGKVAVLAPGAGGTRQVLLGRAGGRLGSVLALPPGGPAAIARAYLGDVAVAVASGGQIRIAVLRYFRHRFGPPAAFAVGRAPVTALAVALDYRSDLVVAWQQGGSVYARLRRNFGALEPIQRVGPSAPGPALQPMLSDNGHAMLAWAAPAAPGSDTTAIRIAFTDQHTHFQPPRPIASFADPAGLARRPGALVLTRLADENVMFAWTSRQGGRYRVLAAPAVFAGVRPSQALSGAGQDATLQALTPGPADEALAVWRAPDGTTSACPVLIGTGDRVLPCTPGETPVEGASAPPAAAVDPGSDRPVLAWTGSGAAVSYAAGPGLHDDGARGYATPAAAVQPRSGTHWLRITVAAALAAAACFALALVLGPRMRARRRG